MPFGPPFAAFPPRTHPSLFVFGRPSPRRAPKRDTARMAASTQGDRLIRKPPWNISYKAGFALFRRKVTGKSSGSGGGGVDHQLHCGDLACRKAADFGVPADDRLVFGKTNAAGFIIGNITFDPLGVGRAGAAHRSISPRPSAVVPARKFRPLQYRVR